MPRFYYYCTLYEDLDKDQVPTDKAKIIATKLDGIGIAEFKIVRELEPIPSRQEQQEQQQSQDTRQYND